MMTLVRLPGRSTWRPFHHRQEGLTAKTSEVLAMPVAVAVPLQRLHPALTLGLSLAELLALAALIATAELAALAVLVLMSAALLVVAALNRRRVLAITSAGIVILVATARGRPLAPVAPASADLALPDSTGLGACVQLAGERWWVDRAAFLRLGRARELLETNRQDQRGEGEDDRGGNRDAVEVALHDGRPRRRGSDPSAEHLRQTAAPAAVEQDQDNQDD
jgi:hypothetical protein